jgi:cellulose synthase/poly-beta-1,6-N-acetylglucosamine synthase-like glycosyltransferase
MSRRQRRNLRDQTIVDDFVIGMKVREQKHRMVYQSAAVAREEPPAAVEHEWRRRVRIGAGDFQALGLCRKCLSPAYGVFAWMFFSHKVLRWFTPHMGMFLVLGSLFLVVGSYGKGVGIVSLAAPLTFLALCLLSVLCAAVGATLRSRPRSPSLFRLCDYFLTMQAALLVGSLRACRGNLKGHWDRTPRTGEMSDAAGQLGQND